MHEEEEEGRPHQTRLVGGAFYDLASQCLTPFTGSGRACNGSQPIAVQARLLGNPGATPVIFGIFQKIFFATSVLGLLVFVHGCRSVCFVLFFSSFFGSGQRQLCVRALH